VQSLWSETGPWIGAKGVQGAERLGLPTSPGKLAQAARGHDDARFAAALVRAALDKDIVDEVTDAARGR